MIITDTTSVRLVRFRECVSGTVIQIVQRNEPFFALAIRQPERNGMLVLTGTQAWTYLAIEDGDLDAECISIVNVEFAYEMKTPPLMRDQIENGRYTCGLLSIDAEGLSVSVCQYDRHGILRVRRIGLSTWSIHDHDPIRQCRYVASWEFHARRRGAALNEAPLVSAPYDAARHAEFWRAD